MWVMENNLYIGEANDWSRAAQFGDGVFETMAIKDGRCQALSLHVNRLSVGLIALHMPSPANDLNDLLLSYIEKMVQVSALPNGVLKIIVSRANSARGYGFDSSLKPVVMAFYSPKVVYPESHYQVGITLQNLSTQCSVQPQLAGLKHLNRLENVLAKNELTAHFYEGLMSNYLGNVIEGTASNIFFERQSKLYTPSLLVSGVAGIMRLLIMQYCKKEGISFSVLDINQADLESFDGALICNSLLGAMPVKAIEKQEFKITPLINKITDAVRSGKIYE